MGKIQATKWPSKLHWDLSNGHWSDAINLKILARAASVIPYSRICSLLNPPNLMPLPFLWKQEQVPSSLLSWNKCFDLLCFFYLNCVQHHHFSLHSNNFDCVYHVCLICYVKSSFLSFCLSQQMLDFDILIYLFTCCSFHGFTAEPITV